MSLFGPSSPKKQSSIIETTWYFNEPPITEIDFKKITSINYKRLSDHYSAVNKVFNKYPDVDYIIAAENEEGPVEYKWSLHKVTTNDRVAHLSTQMTWRLSEGNGHAFYRIGVHDDGQCQGLSPKELNKTLAVFTKICNLAQAEKVKFYKVRLPNSKFVADIHIRKITTARASEMKTIMIGPEGAGKSTLIGCLSEGEKDDGHGMSASFMLRHKHEFSTGRTSTADNFAFMGFDKAGGVLNNSNCEDTEELYKRAEHLVTLIDVAGIAKYRQTLLHGISFTSPDTALIVIQASRKEEFLKDYVELLSRCHIKIMAVVLTHCNEQLASENENKSIYSEVKRSKSEPNLVPLIYCDCKNGFGIEQVQQVFLNEMEYRRDVSELSYFCTTPKATCGSGNNSNHSANNNSNNSNAITKDVIINSNQLSTTLNRTNKDAKDQEKGSKSTIQKQKSSLNIFKILETYQVYSTDGTIVTGRVKSGEIKENDVLTLGPVTQTSNNISEKEEADHHNQGIGQIFESPLRSRTSTSASTTNLSLNMLNGPVSEKGSQPISILKNSNNNNKTNTNHGSITTQTGLQRQLSSSMQMSSSFCLSESPTIISAKKRKRKTPVSNGGTGGDVDPVRKKFNHGRSRSMSFNNNHFCAADPTLDEEPVLNQIKVKILSIEKSRVRIASAMSGELVSLKIIVVDRNIISTEPVVVKRGAMIYNDPITTYEQSRSNSVLTGSLPDQRALKIHPGPGHPSSNFDFTNKVKLKLVNNSYKIDLKTRTRLEIFYDTAKLIGNVKSNGWTTNKNIKFQEIATFSYQLDPGPLDPAFNLDSCIQSSSNLNSLNNLNEPINWTKEGLLSNDLLRENNDDEEDEEDDRLMIQVELESFELIKYGDTCLVSCLRNLTDVTRCEFVRF